MHMELSSDDDDLLSYFLSADVTVDHLAQSKISNDSISSALSQHNTSIASHINNGTPLTDHYGYASQQINANHDRASFGQTSTNTSTPTNAASPRAAAVLQKMNRDFHMAHVNENTSHQLLEDDTSSAAGVDTDEKRQRRLARNRESARQSRRRKKQYLELLEEKVAQLTESIDTTRTTHLQNADESLRAVRQEMVNTLSEKLQTNENGTIDMNALKQEIETILDRFGPNCLERMAVQDYNFRQLDNLLLPPYSRFLLWLSVQDASFFEEVAESKASSGNGSQVNSDTEKKKNALSSLVRKDNLWSALTSELGLTYEQDEKLKSLYRSEDSKESKTERKRIALAMTYLAKLKDSLSVRAKTVHDQTKELHDILTPEQSVKYMAWIENNRSALGTDVESSYKINGTSMSEGVSDPIRAILKKPDHDLSVDDITALLHQL